MSGVWPDGDGNLRNDGDGKREREEAQRVALQQAELRHARLNLWEDTALDELATHLAPYSAAAVRIQTCWRGVAARRTHFADAAIHVTEQLHFFGEVLQNGLEVVSFGTEQQPGQAVPRARARAHDPETLVLWLRTNGHLMLTSHEELEAALSA